MIFTFEHSLQITTAVVLNLGADVGILEQFLCIGDRVALRDFVRKSDKKGATTRLEKKRKCYEFIRKKMRLSGIESDDEEPEGREESEKMDPGVKPRVSLLKGNKNATKETKVIEFGWYHNGKNVRKPHGGGTRQITVLRNARRDDLLREGKKLFFQTGTGRRFVDAEQCQFVLQDLTHVELPPDRTVGEFYDELKLSGKLRFFLCTTGPPLRKELPCALSSCALPKTSTPVASPTQSEVEQPPDFDRACVGVPEDMTDEQDSEVQFGPRPFSGDMSDTVVLDPLEAANIDARKLMMRQATSAAIGTQPKPQATSPAVTQVMPQATSAAGTQVMPQTTSAAGTPLTSQATSAAGTQQTQLYVMVDNVVLMSREPIRIKYQMEVVSKYGGGISTRSCYSRKQCFHTDSSEAGDDPLDLGYFVGSVEKGDKCFLLHTGSEVQFPSHPTDSDSGLSVILHQPDEIWGYEDGTLVLGVISSLHHDDSLSYQWFRGTEPLGAKGCILEVSRADVYYCRLAMQVSNGDTMSILNIDSNQVHVVELGVELEKRTVPVKSNEKCDSTAWNPRDASTPPSCPVINFQEITVYFEERIAQGTFGEVFKGQYAGKPVAVKCIQAKHGKRSDKQILKEAQVHCQIRSHANIVQFIGTCFREKEVFIVTELVSGGNMEDLIYTGQFQDGTPLDEIKKRKLTVGILRGLAYLHGHTPEILHMDIKPANILVDQASITAKLCDLGLAKIRSNSIASTTNALQVAGTIEYMAPERLLLQEKATAACDVWSVAVTVIELLSGEDPWNIAEHDDEPLLVIKAHMKEQKVLPVCSKYEFPLFMSCLNYDPHQRPSAREILLRFECP